MQRGLSTDEASLMIKTKMATELVSHRYVLSKEIKQYILMRFKN